MKKFIIIYEVFMLILVLISIFFALSENSRFIIYDWIIWVIFVVDYSTRFLLSKKKWRYVKQHPFELIAIIPFDSIFRIARFVRIFRVIRLIEIASHYLKPINSILKTNGLDKLLSVTVGLLFIFPIPIILVEPSINTFSDALWWAIVTTTTVGYTDISPTTPIGRILAVVLMFIGIGVIGTLTSAISSYFGQKTTLSHDKQLLEILHSIENLEHLTDGDIDLIQLYLKRKI